MSVAAIRDAVERRAAAPAPGCASCLAFHADGPDRTTGECRRYAPVPGVAANFDWPMVNGDDWCLQHRRTSAPFELTFAPDNPPIDTLSSDVGRPG